MSPDSAPDPDAARIELAADALAGRGLVVVDDFLDATTLAAWRDYALAQRATLRPGAVGRAAGRGVRPAVRSDAIRWLAADEAAPVAPLFTRLDRWRQALNERLFLGLAELELHLACYAPGAAYARHVDRFRDDDARVLTIVLYLNARDWTERDGGALLIEAGPADAPLALLPAGGRLVLFRAERFWHAVLPAVRERWSVTGWLRRRDGRAPAI